jgi:hypothetical protein
MDANGLKTFLPCKIDGAVFLLGVWTQKTDSHDFRYIGQLWKYLNLHKETLRINDSVVIGDFNSNAIWDKKHAAASHTHVVGQLSEVGLYSLYHYVQSTSHGKEPDPTFYLYRNRQKPYHIDYAFLPKDWLPGSTIDIGHHEAWSKYSDHMPVRVKIVAPLIARGPTIDRTLKSSETVDAERQGIK